MDRKVLLGLVFMLMGGCTPAAPVESTAPSATLTPAPTGTTTPSPTAAMPLTPAPSLTPYPMPTAFPFPTPEELAWMTLSPNGEWVTWHFDISETGPYFIVEAMDQNKKWEVRFDFVATNWHLDYLKPVYWSEDGKYLFYVITPPGNGPGLYRVGALHRLNLISGEVVDLLPNQEGAFFAFEFSPDGGSLAFIPSENTPLNLVIRILESGNETSISLMSGKHLRAGQMIWTTDSSGVLFIIQDQAEDEDVFQIVFVDLLTEEIRVIVEDYPWFIYPLSWKDDHHVIMGHDPYSEGELILNIETGELTPIEE